MTDNRRLEATEHPDDVALVVFLDNELSPAESAALGRHVDGCICCQARIRGLQRGFGAFRAAAAATVEQQPPLATALDTFTARLTEVAERQSSARRARRYWRRAVVVAASVVAATGLLLMSGPRLSADSVLAHAEIRELVDRHPTDAGVAAAIDIARMAPGGVPRRVGGIAVVDGSGDHTMHVTIEAERGSAWRGVVAGPHELPARIPWQNWFGEDVARYARERAWVPDVSVAAYRQLVDADALRATVRRVARGLEVHRQVGRGHPSGLSEIVLRIDSSTGLPYELELAVASGGGYVLSRRSLERLREDDQRLSLLEPPPVAPAARLTERLATAPRVVARRLAYADSVATEVEIAAVEAVHRAGADLGEEIAVTPMSDGSVIVEGVVSSKDRASALGAALHGLARVRSTVQSADSFNAASLSGRPPVVALARPPDVRFEDLSGTSLPVLELLEAAGRCDTARLATVLPAGERPVASYATQVVEHSVTALVHAWALERLFRQFDERRVAALSAESRVRLDRVIDAHRAAATTALRAVQSAVVPLATACGVIGDAPRSEPTLADEDIPAVAREQNRLARGLFTRTRPDGNPESTLRALITALRRLG